MLLSLDLFSGYGGIAYALKDYVRPIGYCEIDKYPRAILASRIESGDLPYGAIYPDVRTLRGSLGAVDIITGGFPCQDVSVAGHGAGLDGERSGLFYEIIRLTKEIKPSFVFLENVPGIRTRGLSEVVRTFTEMGYDCRWTCISASSVGAPHKRERWFLLAHTKSERVQGLWTGGEQESHAHAQEAVSMCSSEGPEHANWEAEPDVARVVDGTTFRVDRVKALGNGVVPAQVKEAFERLMGIDNGKV